MDRQQIGLKLTIDALKLSNLFGLENFNDRLILQKVVYLAQAAGVQLGYHFHWYLRGPYSPGLTKEAFAISSELTDGWEETTGWNLDPESQKRIQKLKSLLDDISKQNSGLELAKKMELLASIHFLVKEGHASADDLAALEGVLKKYGKDFTRDEIKKGLKELAEYGLQPKATAR